MPLLPSGFVLYTQAREDSMAAHDSTYDIAMLVMAVVGALHDVCHFILWLTLHTTIWQRSVPVLLFYVCWEADNHSV